MRLPLPQFLTPRRTFGVRGLQERPGAHGEATHTEVSKDLETAVDFSTKGQPAGKVIKKIVGKLAFPSSWRKGPRRSWRSRMPEWPFLLLLGLPARRDDPSSIAAAKFACLPCAA